MVCWNARVGFKRFLRCTVFNNWFMLFLLVSTLILFFIYSVLVRDSPKYKDDDMAHDLPVMDTVKTAWQKVSGAKKTFWVVLSIIFVVQFCLGILEGIFKTADGKLPFFMAIVAIIVGIAMILVSWGLIYLGVQRAEGLPIQYRMVAYAFNMKLFFRMVGFYILEVLLFGFYSLLLGLTVVIPHVINNAVGDVLTIGVYVGWVLGFLYILFRLYLSKALIIAKNMYPLEAIKMSFQATKGCVLPLLGISAVNFLIVFVCAILFGLGLIWGLPYIFINYGEVFKRLVACR